MPENDVRLYDPAKVVTMVNGDYVTGWGDGNFIRAERYEDQYAIKVGATGASARTTNNNQSGSIKIVILQTSPWAKKFRELEKSRDTFPVVCIDNNEDGDDGFTAEQAWVKKAAPFSRGDKDAENMEVEIETNRLIFN